MAVAPSIMTSQDDDNNHNSNNNASNVANDPDKDDHHEQDMVMPGFRFHPTEEELIEFYLRRKVEGKRFNVELITFLDLYRYDPWELPALAAIGEKEWFFYVPRDRKYRNGDRPNRVTTSGYWKATGADRMIRTENFRSIGLKKTLVFYSGKAPKGIRTSWIMNEYRLPQHETERLQKAEISLCRVYKRAGVEDHPSLPRSLPTRASSSSSARGNLNHHASISKNKAASNSQSPNVSMEASFQQMEEKLSDTSGSSSNDHLHHHHHHQHQHQHQHLGSSSLSLAAFSKNDSTNFISLAPMTATTALSAVSAPPPPNTLALPENTALFAGANSSYVPTASIDDLHRLVNFQQYYHSNNPNHSSQLMFSSLLQQTPLPLPPSSAAAALNGNMLPTGNIPTNLTDRLWDWSSMNEASKDHFNSPFK